MCDNSDNKTRSKSKALVFQNTSGCCKGQWNRLLLSSSNSKRWIILIIVGISMVDTTNAAAGSNQNSGHSASTPIISEIHKKVPTGAVIHLFPRYGYLSLSMRVVPRNDSQSWVFLEPFRDIFLGSTLRIEERSFTAPDARLPMHNEFHIDLCEDKNQLLQAYFRRFSIEGLDKPWQAFSGGWRTPSLSKYFGIDPSFIVGNYRYMLVRVMMVRNSGTAIPLANVSTTADFMSKVDNFGNENVDTSIYQFTNNVGSHYIHSYIAGNSLYQVFVYDAFGFEAVKRRLSEYSRQHPIILSQLPRLLPLWAKQIGRLFVLNSSPAVNEQIQKALMFETFKGIVLPNIFKLHDNPRLVKEIESLLKNEPNGLLGIELKSIEIIFSEWQQRQLFIQALKQLMQLWEMNFQ